MVTVLCNGAVRDQLALLSCETSVNSARNVGGVGLYQIISSTEDGSGSFCHCQVIPSTE